MARFQRSRDPDQPGQVLIHAGKPLAAVVWTHDFTQRERTGWFLVMLDTEGEPRGDAPRRLHVCDDVDRLVADGRSSRADWLAQAETVELVTATRAVEAGERALADALG